MLTDHSDESLAIPESTCVGLAKEAISKLNPRSSMKTSGQKLKEALSVNKLDHSSPQKKARIGPVSKRFERVLHVETPIDIIATRVVEREIHLEEAHPKRKVPYRMRPMRKPPFRTRIYDDRVKLT
jgi:hypothetical protein